MTVGFSIKPLHYSTLNDLISHLTGPMVRNGLGIIHELQYREETSLFHLKVGHLPMQFTARDLIAKFTPKSRGHEYALTVSCPPLETKEAEGVVCAHLNNVKPMNKFKFSLVMRVN